MADIQIKCSDIPSVLQAAEDFLNEFGNQNSAPTLEELKALLDQGYFIVAGINGDALIGRVTYSPHFVVIADYYDDESVLIADPNEARFPQWYSIEEFHKDWSFPTPNERNLAAIKV